jgi:hypothetical protein
MAEAKLNWEYALRLSGVGALMVGMCLWSLYDGLAAWPKKNRDLERARPVLLATNLTAEAWIAREEGGLSPFESVFREVGAGAPAKLIKKLGEMRLAKASENRAEAREAQGKRVRALFENAVYSPHDLQTQFVQAAVTLALGLLAFASVGAKARRRYVADATGLYGSGFGKERYDYGEITAIEWSKWEEKGILTLKLKSGRTIRLDGWHFAGMPGIVDEINRHCPDLAAAARRKAESSS